jgi:hypothetical protein
MTVVLDRLEFLFRWLSVVLDRLELLFRWLSVVLDGLEFLFRWQSVVLDGLEFLFKWLTVVLDRLEFLFILLSVVLDRLEFLFRWHSLVLDGLEFLFILLSVLQSNQNNRHSSKSIINTDCCIHTVVPPDVGHRYVPETCTGWRNILSYKLCIKLVFLYTIISKCTVNRTWNFSLHCLYILCSR